MTRFKRVQPAATVAAVAAVLSLASIGCEDDVVAPNDDGFEEGTISVDASSYTDPVYVSLAAGAVVTPADPASSDEWQMSFRRFSVRLNGGVAGSGSVAGVGVGNNASATAEQVAAFTEADGDSAFLAVAADDVPSASAFAEDDLAPDPGGSWFRFDGRLGTLVANPGAAWKTQESSDRGHSVFRVTSLVMEGQRPVGLWSTVAKTRAGRWGIPAPSRRAWRGVPRTWRSPRGMHWDLGRCRDRTPALGTSEPRRRWRSR